MFRKQRQALKDRFAPTFFAKRDFRSGRYFWPPMNGQQGRLAMATEIIRQCGIEQIIETGTYRGATTKWLANFNLPVFSVEIGPTFAAFSRLYLASFNNVKLTEGNSTDFLKSLSADGEVTKRRTFFYLDAHWLRNLPLADEIRLISHYWPEAMIMIDDFEVPDDPGYGSDGDGEGGQIGVVYLRRVPLLGTVYFPSLPSSGETGHHRGCAVIAVGPEMDVIAARLTTLRAYTLD